jgi:hypothetical protein
VNCTDVGKQLDDYLDHSRGARGDSDLDERHAAAIALHIQGCTRCRAELERRNALLDGLRDLPVPAPTMDFFEKTIRTATESAASDDDTAHKRRRTDPERPPSVLMRIAAILLVAAVVGTALLAPDTDSAPDTGLTSISLTTDTVTPVKLAFSSANALADARLSLSLPVGVELVGYDGRSDISWNTDLEAGTNVLRLPLVGRTAGTDLLVARLDHPTGTKTFRLQVTVNDSGATEDD